jgi:V/A-type H+-transporting ATPase subunit A
MLEIRAQGMRLVKMGAPARRLLQLPLLAQARRWKSQFKSEDVAALKEKIAEIPAIFEHVALDYAEKPTED